MYDAVLRVGLPGLSSSSLVEERYISRVRMISPSVIEDTDGNMPLWIVEAKSIQSKLFDSLKSRWQLSLADNRYNTPDRGVMNLEDNTMTHHNAATSSCNVRFEVEIQVSNPLVSLVLDQVLKDVAKKQVDAFERRGNEIPFRQDRVVFR
jgi:ribosome-associated toxin RatA of RatAB toxin-antitoxin module